MKGHGSTPTRPGLSQPRATRESNETGFEDRLRSFAENLESVSRGGARREAAPAAVRPNSLAQRVVDHLERLRAATVEWPPLWPPNPHDLETLRVVAGRIAGTVKTWRDLCDSRDRRRAQRRARALRRAAERALESDSALRSLESSEDRASPESLARAREAHAREMERLRRRLDPERLRDLDNVLEKVVGALSQAEEPERASERAAVRVERRRERAATALRGLRDDAGRNAVVRARAAVRKWREGFEAYAAIVDLAGPPRITDVERLGEDWDRAALRALEDESAPAGSAALNRLETLGERLLILLEGATLDVPAVGETPR